MEIIKKDLYIEGTYYGDVHQGDIFVVFNKNIINDTFVAKTKDDTKYFIALGHSQRKFAGIVINSNEYEEQFSIEISNISQYNNILKHDSYFGCNMLIEVYEDDLYFPMRYSNKHLSLTNYHLNEIIDKLYYIADNFKGKILKKILISYNIFKKRNIDIPKFISEGIITKFIDFIKYYKKSRL